ncbi:integrin alpha-6-like isoform X1 [Astyanax mexicanus]|uniref:Integrin alpha-6-like isoform X1 n=1 Tax=Astyanax mexicanus TaxID=7994 RepID=A0A8T2LR04_ASTMX|nr:integrin alpha-6-like isoform X1 [Astyanax mexicanus]
MLAVRGELILSFWLFTNLQSLQTSAFNLDESNTLTKKGPADSMFGFSLAMHHQVKPTEQQVLLVGAPRSKALPIQKANITGGLFRCKFTTKEDDCERIPVDTTEANQGYGKDYRENQWLGVRVQSQGRGSKVVVCAHRYQYWIYSSQLVLGRCFILDDDLKTYATKMFCLNRPSDKDLFGYCQQGLSPAFTKDGNYILFGAPGAYDWKGTVRMDPVTDYTLDSYETGDQNQYNEHLIPVGISSYLGFSIDSGMNLLNKKDQIIVAGAPRANLSGEVLMLRSDEATRDTRRLSVVRIIKGPGLASSFGYSLTVVDINADGWDDLIVGAPQFSEPDINSFVGGAVYVYVNPKNSKDWDNIQPTVLHGSEASMFGLAVASIGDVNHDGYNDFAVGAPYDILDGAVYIYLGTAGDVSKQQPQVLYGEQQNVKLFGYSLSGNMDIDGNGYPDLAVGSLSNNVVVFRAKPVVHLNTTLELSPNEIDYLGKDCRRRQCKIRATYCFSFTTYPATYNPTINIMYALAADKGRDENYQRLTTPVAETDLVLPPQGQKHCSTTELRLKGNIEDMMSDIPVSLLISLPSDNPAQTLKQSSLPPLKPILNLQPSTAKLKFLNTGCGSDGICHSNLHLQYSFCERDPHTNKCTPQTRDDGVPIITPGNENTALEVTITNKGGDNAHLTKLFAHLSKDLHLSSVISPENKVECDQEDNLKVSAHCLLGNPLKRDEVVKLYLMLNTEKLSVDTENAKVAMVLNTISNQTIPPVVAEAKVVFEMELQVIGQAKPSQVYYGGTAKDEKSITSVEQIGAPVQYEFRVTNMGRPLKSFASATLNVQWPKKDKTGNWLLYLVKITGLKNQIIPCTPAAEISPLKHVQQAPSRERRQVKGEGKLDALSTDKIISLFGGGNRYDYLTCADLLHCVELKCPLQAVDSSAVIVFHARLWNSTFVEDYKSLDYLDIVLNASLSLEDSQNNIMLRGSHTQVRLTVFPEKKPGFLSRFPWWVIFLSVILALLLIALLVYILSKMGCFTCGMCTEDKTGYYPINTNKAAS